MLGSHPYHPAVLVTICISQISLHESAMLLCHITSDSHAECKHGTHSLNRQHKEDRDINSSGKVDDEIFSYSWSLMINSSRLPPFLSH